MNLGQLIQVGTIGIAIVSGYYAMNSKIDKAEMRLGAQQEIIARMEIVTDKLAESQQSIAVTLAKITAKIDKK